MWWISVVISRAPLPPTDRLLGGAALPVNRHAGHGLRPARAERRVAGDVDRLLADLPHAAPDHVVDQRRIDPGPLGQRPERMGREVGRVHAGEASVALADRGPDRLDDDCVSHASLRVPPAVGKQA
jgi:hypothetical protein